MLQCSQSMKKLLHFLSTHYLIASVIGIFAIGGVIFTVASSAATFVVAMEAESGVKSGNVDDGLTVGASNSKSLEFGAATTPPTPTPPTPTPPTPTPPTPTPPTPTTQSIYLTPASGSYAVGSNIVVEIRVNSGTTPINAVQADLAYSSNLQYVSSDVTTSALTITAQNTGGSGIATIALGTITPVTSDQLVAKVTFKVLSAGTGTIDVKDTSLALATSNSQDIITTRLDGSYSLQ
jgi:hypothetical protein